MEENAARLEIDLSAFAEEKIKNSLLEVIERNNLRDGRARLTFFDASASEIWRIESERQTAFFIAAADFRSVSDDLRLTLSPFPINSKSPLAGVKSCNYLENLLAVREAKRRGFDEAVRLNENGEIASGALANIFWTRGDEIFTPPLVTGALRGTTREFLLKNFAVIERRASLDDLDKADEIFFASAGIGVLRAQSFEERIFGDSKAFLKVSRAFDEFIRSASENSI